MKRRTKNRKKKAQGFSCPMPLALFLVLVTVGGVSFLWMEARIEAAGQRLQQLEREHERVGRMLRQEQRKWTQLKTLPNVRAAVARHGLQMDLASGAQVVQLMRAGSTYVRADQGDLARGPGVGVYD